MSQELNDRAAEAKSLLFLANLARLEQNYGQALALLEAAQKIGGDEDFWYSVTMSLAETLAEGEGHEKKIQVNPKRVLINMNRKCQPRIITNNIHFELYFITLNLKQACLILERAISVLKSVLDKRLNRNPVLKFQIASMEAR